MSADGAPLARFVLPCLRKEFHLLRLLRRKVADASCNATVDLVIASSGTADYADDTDDEKMAIPNLISPSAISA